MLNSFPRAQDRLPALGAPLSSRKPHELAVLPKQSARTGSKAGRAHYLWFQVRQISAPPSSWSDWATVLTLQISKVFQDPDVVAINSIPP